MKRKPPDVLCVRLRREADDSYEIVIGQDLSTRIAQDLSRRPLGHRYVVISDAAVMRLYGRKLVQVLRDAGLRVDGLAFRPGEKSKTRRVKEQLEDALLRLGVGRDGVILAVGGGVTGDLAGFVAATYCRGIPYVQVPTSLLAMVDSSIGGKTGVDTGRGKNLIGAFYHPRRVYVDVGTLDTLPEREFSSGLAEVVKHAVIGDRELFVFLERFAPQVLARAPEVMREVLRRSIWLKAQVVESDPREQNRRRVLNYGHTLGHALETLSGYQMRHGEAVSLGMVLEGRLAMALGYFPAAECQRQNTLLERLGLPVRLEGAMKKWGGRKVSVEKIIALTYVDKKARQGRPEYALPARIGRMKQIQGRFGLPVDEKMVRKVLNDSLSGR